VVLSLSIIAIVFQYVLPPGSSIDMPGKAAEITPAELA
jgi:hypothetical protein